MHFSKLNQEIADFYHASIDRWLEEVNQAPALNNSLLSEILGRKLNHGVNISHAIKDGWQLQHYVVENLGGEKGIDYVILREGALSDNKPKVKVALNAIHAVYGLDFGSLNYNNSVLLWRRES